MKRVISYIVIYILIFILSGCSQKDGNYYNTPEETVKRFEEALNFGDLEELLLGLHGMAAEDIKRDSFSLDPREISYSDKKHCVVSVKVKVTDGDGNTEQGMMEIPMVLEDDGWKIKLSLKDLSMK